MQAEVVVDLAPQWADSENLVFRGNNTTAPTAMVAQ